MKNELLIVSYHFPPVISAGVGRLKGLTKYLERSGWSISVITIKKSYVERSDPLAKSDLESKVSIVRSQSLEIDRFNPRRMINKVGEKGASGKEDYPAGILKMVIAALLRYPYAFLHKVLSFPDRQVGWFFPLLLSLVRVIRRRKSKLILSSSPPHSSHLPFLLLKPFCRFRWIVDFRDPWTAPPYYYSNRVSLRLARVLERLVLKGSNRIIANTPGNKKALLKQFPFLKESKITVVTNGFDTEVDVSKSEVNKYETTLDILYLGEVYKGMLDLYLEALRIMIRKKLDRIPKLGVYGSIDSSYYQQFKDNEVKDYLVYRGKVSFKNSIALMRGAKALLLTLPHSYRGSSWVPSKLYAYLFSKRPILAIGPDGDAFRIIESCKAGLTIISTDPEIIAGEIGEFIKRVDKCAIDSREEERIAGYSMKSIAAQVDAILKEEADLLR